MKIPGLPKDSRARSFVLIIVIVIVLILVFLYLRSGSTAARNPSSVAAIPSSIENVPGGKLSPEYYQTLLRSNQQTAQEAQMQGQSSMSTLINSTGDSFASGGACQTQCCDCDHADVSASVKKLLEEGKVSPQAAQALLNAASQDMPVDQYAAMLDRMVKSGQLTPEQARQLLNEYQTQHANKVAENGAKLMDKLIKSGALSVGVANDLLAMQKKGASVADYADELQRLVREGKLSPQAAQALLDQYKAQHDAQSRRQVEGQLQSLVDSGQLPASAASDLLAMQKKGASVADYADELQRLVREGKISPETAKKLLAEYEAAHGGSGSSYGQAKNSMNAAVNSLVSSGDLDEESAKLLIQSAYDNVPVSQYSDELKRLVAAGKLSPELAARLLAQYEKLHALTGADQKAAQLKRQLSGDIQALVAAGNLSPTDAQNLEALAEQNVSPTDYAAALQRLVAEGKLTPEQAKKLLAAYEAAHNAGTVPGSASAIKQAATGLLADLVASGKLSPEVAKYLQSLQDAGVSVADYAKALERLVKEGKLSPEVANQLLEAYRREHAALSAANIGNMTNTSLPKALGQSVPMDMPMALSDQSLPPVGGDFESLQTRMAAASLQQDSLTNSQEALKARQEQLQKMNQAHKELISTLTASMNAQAGNIVKSFTLSDQLGMAATPEQEGMAALNGGDSGAAGGTQNTPSLLKAGAVEYAVLDTAVDSDYPQSPVMATVVQGKLKGAKLMGALQTGAGVNADRVILSFTMMSMPDWPQSVAVQAYAIDPKSASSALATSVNNHYLLRYGALFASSFLQGYSTSLTQAGSTVISGGVIEQTHPELSATQRIWVGLGQVGTNASQAAQQTFDMPPTVKVKSGVGIGILFMQDVAAPTTSS